MTIALEEAHIFFDLTDQIIGKIQQTALNPWNNGVLNVIPLIARQACIRQIMTTPVCFLAATVSHPTPISQMLRQLPLQTDID